MEGGANRTRRQVGEPDGVELLEQGYVIG